MRDVLVHDDRPSNPRPHESSRAGHRVQEESFGIPLPPPILIEVEQERSKQGHSRLPVERREGGGLTRKPNDKTGEACEESRLADKGYTLGNTKNETEAGGEGAGVYFEHLTANRGDTSYIGGSGGGGGGNNSVSWDMYLALQKGQGKMARRHHI